MYNISQQLTQFLIAQHTIDEEDDEIYCYGLEMLLLSNAEIGSILLLSGIVGNFLETFLFFLAFIPVRLFAGGYHAVTWWRCYLLSLMVYGVFSVGLWAVPESKMTTIALVIAAASVLVVFLSQPVVHKNRQVHLHDTKSAKKVSCIIVIVEAIMIVLGVLALPSIFVFAFSLGLLAEIISFLSIKVPPIHQAYSVKRMYGKRIKANAARITAFLLANYALLMAIVSVNSRCAAPFYEPEQPRALEKLKGQYY